MPPAPPAVPVVIPAEAIVPVTDFDARLVQPRDRFDVYRDGASPVFEARPVTDSRDFFSATRDYFVDGVLVSRLRNDAHVMRRDARHLADGSTDWISVQVLLEGQSRGVVGPDYGLVLDQGNVGVLDLARPFTAAVTRSDLLAICVPRDRIEAADRLYQASPILTATRDSRDGRLLASGALRLWHALTAASLTEARILAARFVETLDRVLWSGPQRASDEADARARSFILANLDDLDLDAHAVGGAIGYARSSVYRLFEADGGVHRWIRRLRLRRCLEELTRVSGTPRRITEVATAWGFENPSHFNRLFRAEFGVAPSTVLPRDVGPRPALALASSTSLDLARLNDWQRSAVR